MTDLHDIPDFLTLVIPREDVEAGDISSSLGILTSLVETPELARRFAERVDIAFEGYDDVTQEVFEMRVVRLFMPRLDEQFPFWLYFLSKHHRGLQAVLLCFLPPSLTDAGRARVFPAILGDLLTRRWFPAMNQLCEFAHFSQEEIHVLTDRVEAYITRGLLPSEPGRS